MIVRLETLSINPAFTCSVYSHLLWLVSSMGDLVVFT